jgi:hypothetical protein
MAGLSRIAWVRVDPNPAELLGSTSRVNLVVKDLGHGRVIEGNGNRCTRLLH